MTRALGRQKEVFNAEEPLECFKESKYEDCRINAYPSYTEYRGINLTAPSFLMIDFDLKILNHKKSLIKHYRIIIDRVKNALINSDVIICDEVGPMELKSNEFINTIKHLLKTDKKAIVVIHQKLEHPLIREFREKSNSLININIRNREKVDNLL